MTVKEMNYNINSSYHLTQLVILDYINYVLREYLVI